MTDLDFEQHVRRLFSYGFRPLFLCTCASALLLIPWWVGIMEGWLPAPHSRFDLVSWHAHEMLFGFVGSAIGGFLLTAVANWTRRPPVQGIPLFMLVLAWLAARVNAAWDLVPSEPAAVVIDASYFLLLTTLMGREVIAARNNNNLKIVGLLAIFSVLNISFHFFPQEVIRATTILVCILISVIGGRIIPAFPGNWLRGRFGMQTPVPPGFNRFDMLVIAAMVLLAVLWTLAPTSTVTGITGVAAGLLQLARMARWRGHLTFSEPIVLILHVGYAWLGAGLVLLGLSIFTNSVSVSAGQHALAIGAMTGLIIAVSSRAALGHTNRPLVAGRLLSAAYVLINLTALVRILTALYDPGLLWVAGLLWFAGFLLFTIRFAPVLLGSPPARSP